MANAPSTELVVLEEILPATIFTPGGADDILAALEAKVRAEKTDISTVAGRKAVASLAYKVARSKTALDDLGKNLTADLKKQKDAVDAERRIIWDRLESLQDEVRKPLTEWETAEKKRVDDHESGIVDLVSLAAFLESEPSAELISERLAELETAYEARDWQEFAQRATEAHQSAKSSLTVRQHQTIQREAERAELVRLQAEEVARKQAERDAEIARQAAESARIAAEQKAADEARVAAEVAEAEHKRIEQAATDAAAAAETERKRAEKEAADNLATEQAERQRADRERQEAEDRARQAEADRVAAEKRAQDAAEQAERDRVTALAKAEEDRLAAINAERQRVADEEARVAAATKAREEDRTHKAKINGEVLAALMATGLDADQAKAVVIAIATGVVPHTAISY